MENFTHKKKTETSSVAKIILGLQCIDD